LLPNISVAQTRSWEVLWLSGMDPLPTTSTTWSRRRSNACLLDCAFSHNRIRISSEDFGTCSFRVSTLKIVRCHQSTSPSLLSTPTPNTQHAFGFAVVCLKIGSNGRMFHLGEGTNVSFRGGDECFVLEGTTFGWCLKGTTVSYVRGTSMDVEGMSSTSPSPDFSLICCLSLLMCCY
jgi:hypothetical protein